MASTIAPARFEQTTFGSAPDERDACGVIQCWVDDCDGNRWVDAQSVVSRCPKCGDAAYEYDVPGDVKADEFKKARQAR